MQLNRLRGDFPEDNGILRYYVDPLQTSSKSSLSVHNGTTDVLKINDHQQIRLRHTAEAYAAGLRGYIDTVLPTLKCHMDVQCTDGHGLLLKYVSSYVSKSHDALDKDKFYCRTFFFGYTKWIKLRCFRNRNVGSSFFEKNKLTIPKLENAHENTILSKYYARPDTMEKLSLLQWMRKVDFSKPQPKKYKKNKFFS